MGVFAESFLLLFVLLNPFILVIYLLDLVRGMDLRSFSRQLVRAGLISAPIYAAFALLGEAVFQDVFQVRFLAFQIFGGVVFLLVGIRLILGAEHAIEAIRPDKGEVSAAIVMPFMVGPGTISASVIAGTRLTRADALLCIALVVTTTVSLTIGIKWLYDAVRRRDERLVERYTHVAGRVVALFTGSFAIEMILRGVERWLALLREAA